MMRGTFVVGLSVKKRRGSLAEHSSWTVDRRPVDAKAGRTWAFKHHQGFGSEVILSRSSNHKGLKIQGKPQDVRVNHDFSPFTVHAHFGSGQYVPFSDTPIFNHCVQELLKKQTIIHLTVDRQNPSKYTPKHLANHHWRLWPLLYRNSLHPS